MNKYNDLGLELIEFKNELNKDYPILVKKSLGTVVDNMLKEGVIDKQTHFLITSDYDKVDELKEYLLTKQEYCKTLAELEGEYEMIRQKIVENLKDVNVDETLKAVNIVDKEIISVVKSFHFGEEFCRDFFGIKEEEVQKLMVRKGFFEKFTILRLSAITTNFLKTIEYPKEFFKCSTSVVFYDANLNKYGIDFLFAIPISKLENEENISYITSNIKDIVANLIKYFDDRILI